METESCNKNRELHMKEVETGHNSNGLSNLSYEVLSSFEFAPRFTCINVDFKTHFVLK
jgi:hypothetical protein